MRGVSKSGNGRKHPGRPRKTLTVGQGQASAIAKAFVAMAAYVESQATAIRELKREVDEASSMIGGNE